MTKVMKTTAFALLLVLAGAQVVDAQSGYGGSGGGGGGTRVKDLVKAPTEQVLGETTDKFVFNNDLRLGSTHPDVMELQKRLRKEGFFTFPTDTGYFGPVTLAAVKAYQAEHPEIGYVTGFCGPLTRGVLNK